MKDKIRKNLDLTENCVRVLSKEAIDKKTVFKLYAESILEEAAKKKKK
jgi:hypothetical protein